mmetsp:Transcript_20976/g.80894  ORF Transcript_20976/g.80894 Transcript_20976/m.80894 type:complete len:372 (-) Transcript_20976:475-1590(-)
MFLKPREVDEGTEGMEGEGELLLVARDDQELGDDHGAPGELSLVLFLGGNVVESLESVETNAALLGGDGGEENVEDAVLHDLRLERRRSGEALHHAHGQRLLLLAHTPHHRSERLQHGGKEQPQPRLLFLRFLPSLQYVHNVGSEDGGGCQAVETNVKDWRADPGRDGRHVALGKAVCRALGHLWRAQHQKERFGGNLLRNHLAVQREDREDAFVQVRVHQARILLVLGHCHDCLCTAEASGLILAAVQGIDEVLQNLQLEHDARYQLVAGKRQMDVEERVLRLVAEELAGQEEQVSQALEGGGGQLVLVLILGIDEDLDGAERRFNQLRLSLQAVGQQLAHSQDQYSPASSLPGDGRDHGQGGYPRRRLL